MPRAKSLVTITQRLGKEYDRWKKYEKKKDSERSDFFEAATRQATKEALATQTVAISPPRPQDEAAAYLAKYYPRWNAIGWGREDGLITKVVLEENPALTTFSFVNERDGRVYTRQVDTGSAVLDDERLAEEDPELYEQVTFTTPWGDTLLWPLDKLDEQTMAQLQGYIYHDKPKVKLAAPRKAKPEELG